MTVVVLLLVFLVLGALLVGGLLAAGRSQGAESEIMQAGFTEPDDERLVDIEREVVAQVESGVEGHGEGAPEPAGPPPVPGAQWDETHASWIVWDASAGGWVPVAAGTSEGAAPEGTATPDDEA
ncbi:MAG: hypothetical protein U0Q07_09820 [Acidimicrobiales bacterium]